MRKFVAILLTAILLAGLVCACAETQTETVDLTGDWTMDYFGIPMVYFFYEDGTFEAIIDMDIPVADDGSNSFPGTWEFDGTTLSLHGDDGDAELTWDGEMFTGVMFEETVNLVRAVEPEEPAE